MAWMASYNVCSDMDVLFAYISYILIYEKQRVSKGYRNRIPKGLKLTLCNEV